MPKSRADSLAVTVITGLRNAAPAAPLEYVVYLQQCAPVVSKKMRPQGTS